MGFLGIWRMTQRDGAEQKLYQKEPYPQRKEEKDGHQQSYIYCKDCAERDSGCGCSPWMVRGGRHMGFEIFDSGNEVAVQENTRWERNRRMAVEVATVLVAVAGIIGIAIENAEEKRKE